MVEINWTAEAQRWMRDKQQSRAFMLQPKTNNFKISRKAPFCLTIRANPRYTVS